MRKTKLNKYSKKEIPKLKRKLKKLFHAWVRSRDGNICISCNSKNGNQSGHFVADGVSGMTRFHPQNVNVQCPRCNLFESGNSYEYGKALDVKYGLGTADKLRHLSRNNNYQDEVITLNELILVLQNSPEDYEELYYDIFKKYEL